MLLFFTLNVAPAPPPRLYADVRLQKYEINLDYANNMFKK